MSKISSFLVFLIFLILFAGCSQSTAMDSTGGKTTTPISSEEASRQSGILSTSTRQVPAPEFTPGPTDTQTVEATIESPVFTLTSTTEPPQAVTQTTAPQKTVTGFSTLPPIPSSTPTASIPVAPIRIFAPGDGSIVRSPIPLEAIVSSNNGALLRIELVGEKDRLLTRIIKKPNQLPWPVASLSLDVLYQISQVREKGRLIISVDDFFGRTVDANSVALTITNQENEQIFPSGQIQRNILIEQPEQDESIAGSKLLVEGLVDQRLSSELKLKIVAENGKVLGQRLTSGIGDVNPEGYMVFSGEVPYSVSKDTPARLMVFVDSQTGSQVYYLASVEVILKP